MSLSIHKPWNLMIEAEPNDGNLEMIKLIINFCLIVENFLLIDAVASDDCYRFKCNWCFSHSKSFIDVWLLEHLLKTEVLVHFPIAVESFSSQEFYKHCKFNLIPFHDSSAEWKLLRGLRMWCEWIIWRRSSITEFSATFSIEFDSKFHSAASRLHFALIFIQFQYL